jgi:hypothetical protein
VKTRKRHQSARPFKIIDDAQHRLITLLQHSGFRLCRERVQIAPQRDSALQVIFRFGADRVSDRALRGQITGAKATATLRSDAFTPAAFSNKNMRISKFMNFDHRVAGNTAYPCALKTAGRRQAP